MGMLRQLSVALGVFDRVRIDHDSSAALGRTLVAVAHNRVIAVERLD